MEWTHADTNVSVNVFYIKFGAHVTLNQAGADAWAGAFEDAFDTSGIATYLSTDTKIDHIVVTDLDSVGAPQFLGAFDAFAGASGADYLPLQTAGMIEWQTALRGRSFRGKTFLAGFTEAASDGAPVAGLLTDLDALGDALIDAIHDTGPPTRDLAVVSRFSGSQLVDIGGGQIVKRPLPRAEAIATAITGRSSETVWKTQRRRAFPG
jgi:hypothetical protein